MRRWPAPITLREFADIPVERLKGVGEKKQASLAVVGIHTVLDLVTTYPRRWVDRTNEARIADLNPGEEALVLVTVRSVTKRMTRNRRSMVNVAVGDGSGRMDVVFFNQPWRERQLKEGLQIALFGKADTYRGGLQMSNPVVDLIGDRTARIVPIYPQSEKAQISTWELAGWVEEALRRCNERGIADPVPAAVRERLGLVARGTCSVRSTRQSRCVRRNWRGVAWPSTNSCACSSSWCCASVNSNDRHRGWSTRSAVSSCIDSTTPCHIR